MTDLRCTRCGCRPCRCDMSDSQSAIPSPDLLLSDEKMHLMIKDYGWGKTKEERGFILGVMGVTSEAQLVHIQKYWTLVRRVK